MSSTKTPTGAFYAVRRGKGGLEKCIFFHYKDAAPFIEVENDQQDDAEQVEYHVFDSLEEAGAYLQTTTEPLDAQMLASIAAVVNVPSPTPAAKKQRFSYECADGGQQHRKPTKKWEENFALLQESLENGFTDENLKKLEKWMKDQRYNYKLFQQGKSTSMTAEKIARLRAIGFKLPVVDCTPPLVKNEAFKEKRSIYKKWYEQRDALKQYMDTHDGSAEIDKDDKEHAKLKGWLDSQQSDYKKYVNGQESNMTAEKIQLLQEIGFHFHYVPFEVRLEQLKAFRAEHGHVDVPSSHEELGKWVQSMRRQCKSFAETAESTRDINPGRYAQLSALGLDPTKRSAKNDEEENGKWETMYAKLVEYKNEHGTSNVKRTEETRDLYNWLVLQRTEYKKLQDNKPSKLTAPRLIKFNTIGFEFNKRGSYKTWDQRIDQLREFKEKHGHINIPVTNPELGEFVGRQRANYNKFKNNEKTSMTAERIAILEELGFNFGVGVAQRRPRTTVNKTWDERCLELAAFKNEFGHAVVPQHSHYTPGLGAWVKDQRKGYKAMISGKKSSMTPEKALRLASLGFVWNVFEQSKRRKRGEMEGDSGVAGM
jgi:hypothetical protein